MHGPPNRARLSQGPLDCQRRHEAHVGQGLDCGDVGHDQRRRGLEGNEEIGRGDSASRRRQQNDRQTNDSATDLRVGWAVVHRFPAYGASK
jgi:hypothetical protein